MPEVSEEELAAFQAQEAENTKLRDEASEAGRTIAEGKKYQQDVETYIQRAQNYITEQDTKIKDLSETKNTGSESASDDDDELFRSSSSSTPGLSKAEVAQVVQETIAPVVQTYMSEKAVNQRDQLIRRATEGDPSLKHLETYLPEVDQFMKGIDPGAAGQAGSYEAAYRLVLTRHIDEIESKAAESSREVSEGPEAVQYVEDDKGEFQILPTGPVAVGSGGATPTKTMSRGRTITLTRAQLNAAKATGMTPKAYKEHWDKDKSEDYDVLGFGGRERI